MVDANDSLIDTVRTKLSSSSVDDIEGDVEDDVEDDVDGMEDDVEDGVENECNTIEQDVPIPSVLPTSSITDVIGNIGDMLDGDTTTADGTVIPKGVMVNTACIIFGDFAATFIAYAVVTNIVVFGEQFLHYDRDGVEQTNLIVIGVDAGFFLLTGCITDWFGGYSTSLHIYGLVCFVGTCILPLLTFDWSVFGPSYGISIPIRRIFFYMARFVTGFGVCGIQATSPPFAARQIEKYGSAGVQNVFHYIYMAVQCAPLLALTGLSFVQLNVSFFIGYLSTVAVNILTMLFFKYVKSDFRQSIPDNGKAASLILTTAAKSIKSKLSRCSLCCNCDCCPNLCSSIQSVDEESLELLTCSKSTSTTANDASMENTSSSLNPASEPSGSKSNKKNFSTDPQTMAATYGSTELTTVSSITKVAAGKEKTPSTPSSTADLSGSAPEDKSSSVDPGTTATTPESTELNLDMCVETLPESVRHVCWICYAMLLLSCQVPYSIMRYQISTSYISQALRMKPTILGQSVSSSLLQECLPLVGIVFAPIVNVYIYPYISTRFTTLTMPNRTMVGIALATISVFSAAIVETARVTFIDRGDSFVQEINNQTIVASTLPLDALIPQYLFMGAADVFIYITSLEFAFRQSPCTMQVIATGIFLFYEAIGRIVAILLVPLINTITAADPWYPHEINDGHLNYYFLVLTAISLTSLIIYCLLEKGYEEVDQYLCPEEETYGGATTSGSSTPATATAGTPILPNPPVTLPQPATSATPSA